MALPTVSVVCVYNDEQVRRQCLDASIDALDPERRVIQYLPVDNRGQAYSTAGAALNEGARQASAKVVAFAHQDVVLHDLDALVRAAGILDSRHDIGVLGAVGVDRTGATVGLLRDRVALIGGSRQTAGEVETLDEVVFMARRDMLLEQPLTEMPVYAWHAYAVEYSLRLHELGYGTFAIDLGVTHNSRSINVANLWGAHRNLAGDYAHRLPIRTTCGTISDEGSASDRASASRRASHRWRLRRLFECVKVLPIRLLGRVDVVLADIRYELDEIAAAVDAKAVNVVHCGRTISEGEATLFSGQTSVQRYGRRISFSYHDLAQGRPGAGSGGTSVVYLNLGWTDVLRGVAVARSRELAVGYHRDLGYFLFVGAVGSPEIQYKYAVTAAFATAVRPRTAQPIDTLS